MATVVAKLRVMPTSPDVDLKKLEIFCKSKIEELKAKFHSAVIEAMAFGLKSLTITLFGEEAEVNLDKIEAAIKESADVSSTEVTDVRRAVG